MNKEKARMGRLIELYELCGLFRKARRKKPTQTRTAIMLIPTLLKLELRTNKQEFPGQFIQNLRRTLRSVLFEERRLQLERLSETDVKLNHFSFTPLDS